MGFRLEGKAWSSGSVGVLRLVWICCLWSAWIGWYGASMQQQQQPHFQQPLSRNRFCNLSFSNIINFPFNINITIIFALLLSTTSPSTTSTSLPEDLSDSISLLRVGQWTMESNGQWTWCWKSYSSTCFSTCVTAASMISGELCVVVSHSSMYSCRPRPSCLGNILFM